MHRGFYYPFNADNEDKLFRPLITKTYFDNNGVLPTTPGGIPKITPVGWGTEWPIGMLPESAYDLWANVKCMHYNVSAVFDIEGDFSSVENFTTQGLIKRIFVSSASIFRHKFQSIGAANGKSTTDDVIFDFTKCFYDIRDAVGLAKNYFWFPQIIFTIAGRSGSIVNAPNSTSGFMTFDNFLQPISSIPIQATPSVPGITISAVIFESNIVMTERYDQITFDPQSGGPGTQVTITCPAFKPQFDNPANRDGFIDVVSITFGNSTPVTTFTKNQNANGVTDSIVVTVPSDATTGVIGFTSNINPSKQNMLDYYNTCTKFIVA